MARGDPPGPQYRPVMAAALAAQDDGAFTDRAGAVAWLAEIAADGGLERYLAEGAH